MHFVTIWSATSYPFGFTSRIKRPPLDILKVLVITSRKQNEKFSFIPVAENGAPAIFFEFIKTCHNMNIRVQTSGEDASCFNGKSEIFNMTLANITRDLLLNSSNNK